MSGLVIAIPHAGLDLPAEVRDAMLPHVDRAFRLSQSDAYTDRVYAVPGARTVRYPWSRLLADPNRAEDQVTEGGVLPTTDFDERPVYQEGRAPGIHEHHVRILRYHRPYHDAVAKLVDDTRSRVFIDGHSMMEVAPRRSPDFGHPRPDAVLGNRPSDKLSDFGLGSRLTCPMEVTEHAQERLRYWLTHLEPPGGGTIHNLPTGWVTLNDPFPGGFGVSHHSSPESGVVGLMVELNQRLWVDNATFEPLPGRIEWMRDVLSHWLAEVVERADAWWERAQAGVPDVSP